MAVSLEDGWASCSHETSFRWFVLSMSFRGRGLVVGLQDCKAYAC